MSTRNALFNKLLRDVWDDACNAVCQDLQEGNMCNCAPGYCIAAQVLFPAKLYKEQMDTIYENIRKDQT